MLRIKLVGAFVKKKLKMTFAHAYMSGCGYIITASSL